MCAHVCLRLCVPNIITSHQGYFPLSGLGVPAGVDWEKIRAYSLDYKRSCKQSHIVAMEQWQRLPAWRRLKPALAGWLAGGVLVTWLRGQLVVGELPHSSHTWRTENWEGFLEREAGKRRIMSDVACSDRGNDPKRHTIWCVHQNHKLTPTQWQLSKHASVVIKVWSNFLVALFDLAI